MKTERLDALLVSGAITGREWARLKSTQSRRDQAKRYVTGGLVMVVLAVQAWLGGVLMFSVWQEQQAYVFPHSRRHHQEIVNGITAEGSTADSSSQSIAIGKQAIAINDPTADSTITIAAPDNFEIASTGGSAVFAVNNTTGVATFSGASTDVGWRYVKRQDTACVVTCGGAAVFGVDLAGGENVIVGPNDITADACVCASR